jgi:hypothetical protein
MKYNLSVWIFMSIICFAICVRLYILKARQIKSLSRRREFDGYVGLNMIFQGSKSLQTEFVSWFSFPYDKDNEHVIRELKNAWPLALTTYFFFGTTLALLLIQVIVLFSQ